MATAHPTIAAEVGDDSEVASVTDNESGVVDDEPESSGASDSASEADHDEMSRVEPDVVPDLRKAYNVANGPSLEDIESAVLSQRGIDARSRLFAASVAALVVNGRPPWRRGQVVKEDDAYVVDVLPWVQMRRRMFVEKREPSAHELQVLWDLADKVTPAINCADGGVVSRPRLLPAGMAPVAEDMASHLRKAMAVQLEETSAALRTLDPDLRSRAAALASPYVLNEADDAEGATAGVHSSGTYPVRLLEDGETVATVCCDPVGAKTVGHIPLAVQRMLTSTPAVYWSRTDDRMVDPGDEVLQRGVLLVSRGHQRSRASPILAVPSTRVFEPKAYQAHVKSLKVGERVEVLFDFPVRAGVRVDDAALGAASGERTVLVSGQLVTWAVAARVGSADAEWITLDFGDALRAVVGSAPLQQLNMRRDAPFQAPFFVYGEAYRGVRFSRTWACDAAHADAAGEAATLVAWADTMNETLEAVVPGPVQRVIAESAQRIAYCLNDCLESDDHPSADATMLAVLGTLITENGTLSSALVPEQSQPKQMAAQAVQQPQLLGAAHVMRRMRDVLQVQAEDVKGCAKARVTWEAMLKSSPPIASTVPTVPPLTTSIGMQAAADDSYPMPMGVVGVENDAAAYAFIQSHLCTTALSVKRRPALVRGSASIESPAHATWEYEFVGVEKLGALTAAAAWYRGLRDAARRTIAEAGVASLLVMQQGMRELDADASFCTRVVSALARPSGASFPFTGTVDGSRRRELDASAEGDDTLLKLAMDDLTHYRRVRVDGGVAERDAEDDTDTGQESATDESAGALLDALLDAAGVVGVARASPRGRATKLAQRESDARRLLVAAAALYDPETADVTSIQQQMRRHIKQIRLNRPRLMKMAIAKGQGGDYAAIERSLIAGVRRRVMAAFSKQGTVVFAALLVVLLEAAAKSPRPWIRAEPATRATPLARVAAGMHEVLGTLPEAATNSRQADDLLQKRVAALRASPPIGLLRILQDDHVRADTTPLSSAAAGATTSVLAEVPWPLYRPLLGLGFMGAGSSVLLGTMQAVLKGERPLNMGIEGAAVTPRRNNSCCMQRIGPTADAHAFFFSTPAARSALALAAAMPVRVQVTAPPGVEAAMPVPGRGSPDALGGLGVPVVAEPMELREIRVSVSVDENSGGNHDDATVQGVLRAFLVRNPRLEEDEAALVHMAAGDAIGPSSVGQRIEKLLAELMGASSARAGTGREHADLLALMRGSPTEDIDAAVTAREMMQGFLCVDVCKTLAVIAYSGRNGTGGVHMGGLTDAQCTGDQALAGIATRLAMHEPQGEADALRTGLLQVLHGSTNNMQALTMSTLVTSSGTPASALSAVRVSASLHALIALSIFAHGALRPTARAPALAAAVTRPLAHLVLARLRDRMRFDQDDAGLRYRLDKQREVDKQRKLGHYQNMSDEDKIFMKDYKKVRDLDWDDIEALAARNMANDDGLDAVADKKRVEDERRKEEYDAIDFFNVDDGIDHVDGDDTLSDADADADIVGEEGGVGETDG